jgi:hypothetical protein
MQACNFLRNILMNEKKINLLRLIAYTFFKRIFHVTMMHS